MKVLSGHVTLSAEGLIKAIWERIERPSLNKKGVLCFQLFHVWPSAVSHQHLESDDLRDPKHASRSPQVEDVMSQ